MVMRKVKGHFLSELQGSIGMNGRIKSCKSRDLRNPAIPFLTTVHTFSLKMGENSGNCPVKMKGWTRTSQMHQMYQRTDVKSQVIHATDVQARQRANRWYFVSSAFFTAFRWGITSSLIQRDERIHSTPFSVTSPPVLIVPRTTTAAGERQVETCNIYYKCL
jgi:hypothetical protein